MSHNEVFSRDGDVLTETFHNREWLPDFLDNPADPLSAPSSDHHIQSYSEDPMDSSPEHWDHQNPFGMMPWRFSIDSETSGYKSWSPHIPAAVKASSCSADSIDSRDSGYESLNLCIPDTVESVRGKETTGTNRVMLHYLHPGCEYQTSRQYDLDRHQRAHFLSSVSEGKYDCPGRGCDRTGEHGFLRKDHLCEHLRKVHVKDTQKIHSLPSLPEEHFDCPGRGCGRIVVNGFLREDHLRENLRKVHKRDIAKQNRRSRSFPGDLGPYNANLEAPSELEPQGENHNEMPPMPPMEPVKYSSRILKPVGLPETTMLLGNPSNLERLRSLSPQSPYVAEKTPGTASGIKKSVSHDMGEDDKESPSSTSLESVRNMQVAPEPKITHGKSIPQSVKLGYEYNGLNPTKIERRPSTIFADVERSTMTITEEHGVQDRAKQSKIVSEPGNEARPSTLNHSIRTTPLAVMDADDELMSSLSDDGSEQAQHSDDGSVVDDSCSSIKPVEYLANVIMAVDGAKTYFSEEPIEPAEDTSRHQKPLELPEAIMRLGDTSMPRSSMLPEKIISGHTHPVGLPENMTMAEDAAQMNTAGSLVEVVNDQSSYLAHDTQANTKPIRMMPQYDTYVMTLLSLRIELRVWLGRRAPSPTIHISTRGETLLEDGKKRIRWTCRCGRRLYDDFEELRPGALEELEQKLNEQNRVCSPEGNGSGQHRGSSIRALWNAAGGIIGSLTGSRPFQNNNLPTLPLHQHHAAGQERNSQSSATSESLFLLMCIPYRKYGTRLVHMDLAELVLDETLFRKLRHEYQSIRGKWASYFSLWKMAEIQFVKFGLHKHQLVDIKEKNDLPPANLKHEYRYRPIPAETIPPIGKNHLMHLYEHPDHSDDGPFCLEKIPKKVREQLRLSQHQPPGLLGWGVYFTEGFDWPKFWVFGLIVLSLSVLFGVCWSTLRQDVQGGFGVTACMMVAVTFTTGVVQAAVEQR